MHELNSFKKLLAEIGNYGHGECTALAEGHFIRHVNNSVGWSGENGGEWDGVISWSRNLTQVCKQLDLIRPRDAFQYHRLALGSVGIRDVSALRMDQKLGHRRCVAETHIP